VGNLTFGFDQIPIPDTRDRRGFDGHLTFPVGEEFKSNFNPYHQLPRGMV